jgi:glycosyltransferase involved in cell wall biosynthesis
MLYLVDLESVETRYTSQWKKHLPLQLQNNISDITIISGGDVPQCTTPGAFLNFAGTNSYKSQQLLQISKLFASGKIKDGDFFLFTDAWNPTVLQLKYMAELLGIKIIIGGMWHAGSYDPHDFLGRQMGGHDWVTHAEKSMFYCYDYNFFATRFHVNIFAKNLMKMRYVFEEDPAEALMFHHPNIKIVGWPMEYLRDTLSPFTNTVKKNKIIFPHRIAPEKQLDIFKDLAASMPEYEWFVAQESSLTKDEYHQHLAESKIVFSANLQETLGISMYEGALVGTFPLVPDRLSYSEMWKCADDDTFLYPSEWTESFSNYLLHKNKLISKIRNIMNSNENSLSKVTNKADAVGADYFDGTLLYSIINDAILDSAT